MLMHCYSLLSTFATRVWFNDTIKAGHRDAFVWKTIPACK